MFLQSRSLLRARVGFVLALLPYDQFALFGFAGYPKVLPRDSSRSLPATGRYSEPIGSILVPTSWLFLTSLHTSQKLVTTPSWLCFGLLPPLLDAKLALFWRFYLRFSLEAALAGPDCTGRLVYRVWCSMEQRSRRFFPLCPAPAHASLLPDSERAEFVGITAFAVDSPYEVPTSVKRSWVCLAQKLPRTSGLEFWMLVGLSPDLH